MKIWSRKRKSAEETKRVTQLRKKFDSNENGYILFEGKRTMLGWMIDSAIVPLNGKVHCENTEEGIITKEVEIKMMIHVLYAGTREILTAVMVARQLSIRAAWALK
ncbi:EF-hand domain pair protein [Raphanus sativus]|nr:EF-hand domain pair protein [Raphanus sativus]